MTRYVCQCMLVPVNNLTHQITNTAIHARRWWEEATAHAGVLVSIDGYMNVAMEQTEEYVDGQLQNQYGDAFIRGNNVLYISASKEASAAPPPEAAA